MSTTEIFLLAMLIIFVVPYAIWRLFRTDYVAPLVIVQIIMGVVLGPGVLGAAFPDYHRFVFNPDVVKTLNGIAQWGVMLFVMLAGIELDLKKVWTYRRESATTAGLALGTPLLFGCAAAVLLMAYPGWMGAKAAPWQFTLGTGMACAVTALPILVLLMQSSTSCACRWASASCATEAWTMSRSGASLLSSCWTGSASAASSASSSRSPC